MTTLAALTTPCLLLEDEKLQANMDRLARRLHERGVSLRPHLKTCKNIEIARRCMESPSGPATVSTLAEAEYFAAGGVHGICYAVGIAPNKLERVAELRRRGIDLSVVLDNEESARLLVDFARQRDCRLAVLLEIDCDGHRAGLRPDDPRLTAIAALLRDGGQEVRGVLTHAGSAYDLPTTEAIAALAVQETVCVRVSIERMMARTSASHSARSAIRQDCAIMVSMRALAASTVFSPYCLKALQTSKRLVCSRSVSI